MPKYVKETTVQNRSNETALLVQDNGDGAMMVMNNPPAGVARSKAELMAELMSKPETYDKFGSAWRLAIRLLNNDDGKLVGTYEEIARQVGVKRLSRDSVRNWANQLAKRGVAKLDQKKCHVSLTLVGEYMTVAGAPTTVTRTVRIGPAEDRRMAALRKMAAGAAELGGWVHVTIEGCNFEADDGEA